CARGGNYGDYYAMDYW
nr:immunoglobulin heavy chain junction region [Mus musculus]